MSSLLASSTLPPSPTSTGVATSTSTSSGSDSSPNPLSARATLYIYTFLATLVLLLAVSSAIVIRSLIIRRRHQRLVEEAIRAGTWVPQNYDPLTGRRRRDFGEKPKLWEAWVHSTNNDDDENGLNEKSKWGDMTPLYAAYVHEPTSSPQGPPGSADHTPDASSRTPRFLRSFTARRSPPSPQPNSVSPTAVAPGASPSASSPISSPSPSPSPSMRVAVLIAMPSSSPPKHHADDDIVPILEIGVVEAGIKETVDA